MRASEILTGLLEAFALAVPQAEFREAWLPGGAGRLPAGPVVTGEVVKESAAGEGRDAVLGFTVTLPRGAKPEQAGGIAAAMESAAQLWELVPDSVERGALSVSKTTGTLALTLTFRYSLGTGGGAKKIYPVKLGGKEYGVSGWKISLGGSVRELTAVGEDVPFARKGGGGIAVELQGLSQAGLETPDGFEAQVGGRIFEDCRWKGVSAGGGGTFMSDREKEA